MQFVRSNINQLEKLEAAKSAYLWLLLIIFGYLSSPFVTFHYLSLPFPTFPYLSLPFLTGPYWALRGHTGHCGWGSALWLWAVVPTLLQAILFWSFRQNKFPACKSVGTTACRCRATTTSVWALLGFFCI